jgi:hypothetical protein
MLALTPENWNNYVSPCYNCVGPSYDYVDPYDYVIPPTKIGESVLLLSSMHLRMARRVTSTGGSRAT